MPKAIDNRGCQVLIWFYAYAMDYSIYDINVTNEEKMGDWILIAIGTVY
jgi:hypothetical protein